MMNQVKPEPASRPFDPVSDPSMAGAGQETGAQSDQQRKGHSDRILAFLRKYPEQVNFFL
jgi:hypothetical protein